MSLESAQSAAHVRVRYEEPDDAPAIRKVTEAAFDSPVEAKIVDALRAAGVVTLSMVAVIGADEIPAGSSEDVCAPLSTWGGEGEGWGGRATPGERPAKTTAPAAGRVVGGEVIGHVLVTPVVLTTDQGEERLLGLGPVAVLPEHQGLGVGTQLVETCLERLRESGVAGVVVVGSPDYYCRFGFIPGEPLGIAVECTGTRGTLHGDRALARPVGRQRRGLPLPAGVRRSHRLLAIRPPRLDGAEHGESRDLPDGLYLDEAGRAQPAELRPLRRRMVVVAHQPLLPLGRVVTPVAHVAAPVVHHGGTLRRIFCRRSCRC